jgi:hypothetical protein
MLTPSADKVAAIEAKATLQPDRWPRLAPLRMNQMTTQWLVELGNGMIATELQAAGVYGLIAMVQFARRQLKVRTLHKPRHSIGKIHSLPRTPTVDRDLHGPLACRW